MVRISWIHPDVAASAEAALLRGRRSWEEAFASGSDAVLIGDPPPGVAADRWPALAEHVARAARVREVVAQAGRVHAHARFASSPHAVERAALLAGETGSPDEADGALGVLACPIDECVVYGHFLSRVVELCAGKDPTGTVAAFERWLDAARAHQASEPSWPERLRAAEDGLASLYARVGRAEDAQAVYERRFAEDERDTAVAISAARAFLEHGEVSRAIAWLGLAAGRAAVQGRDELADRLRQKATSLRARLS